MLKQETGLQKEGSSGASTKSDERAVLWGFKREKDPAGGENWEIIQEQGVLENRE